MQQALIGTERPFSVPLPRGERVRGFHQDRGALTGIFLHGFRSNCEGEKALALARQAHHGGRSWVRFDQRGHGRSDGDFADYSLSAAIEDLLAVLKHLSGRPVLLVGSSFGGLVALHAALRQSGRVQGLLLIAPALRFFERYFESLPSEVRNRWAQDGIMRFPDTHDGGSFELSYNFFKDAGTLGLPGLVRLSCPLWIIHGEADEVLPIEDTRQWLGSVHAPSLGFDAVPGGDHQLRCAIPLIGRRIDQLRNETQPK